MLEPWAQGNPSLPVPVCSRPLPVVHRMGRVAVPTAVLPDGTPCAAGGTEGGAADAAELLVLQRGRVVLPGDVLADPGALHVVFPAPPPPPSCQRLGEVRGSSAVWVAVRPDNPTQPNPPPPPAPQQAPPPPPPPPVSGTADPRVVKQDKSSRGSVDTKHVRTHRGSE